MPYSRQRRRVFHTAGILSALCPTACNSNRYKVFAFLSLLVLARTNKPPSAASPSTKHARGFIFGVSASSHNSIIALLVRRGYVVDLRVRTPCILRLAVCLAQTQPNCPPICKAQTLGFRQTPLLSPITVIVHQIYDKENPQHQHRGANPTLVVGANM